MKYNYHNPRVQYNMYSLPFTYYFCTKPDNDSE